MENCPITTVTSKTGKKNNQIKIAIKVKDFENISAITLRLEYDPEVMTWVRCEPAKEFATLDAPLFHASPIQDPGMSGYKLMMAWASITPLTFTRDNRVLFYAVFKGAKDGGTTELNFNNEISGGGMCEYANAQAQVLVDTPTDEFYHNGEVTFL